MPEESTTPDLMELVRGAFEAANRRNVNALMAFFAPDALVDATRTVGVAPLNRAALAGHPRQDAIVKLYNDEVAAFKAGSKSMVTVFTGPIKDNTGTLRLKEGQRATLKELTTIDWFVEGVVGKVPR